MVTADAKPSLEGPGCSHRWVPSISPQRSSSPSDSPDASKMRFDESNGDQAARGHRRMRSKRPLDVTLDLRRPVPNALLVWPRWKHEDQARHDRVNHGCTMQRIVTMVHKAASRANVQPMKHVLFEAFDDSVANGPFLIVCDGERCWVVSEEFDRVHVQRMPMQILEIEDILRINSLAEIPLGMRGLYAVFLDLLKSGDVTETMIIGERGAAAAPLPKKPRDHGPIYIYGPTQTIKEEMISPAMLHFWGSVEKVTPHSLDSFISAVKESMIDVWREWRWAPKRLVMKIVTPGSETFGSARRPLHEDAPRLVSLNPRLFTEYSMGSIKRTLLHELAHHKVYDEELETGVDIESHGDRFCELLSMVDPTVVGDRERCVHFVEDEDHEAMLARLPRDPSKFYVEVDKLKTKKGLMIRFWSLESPRRFRSWQIKSSRELARAMRDVFGDEAKRVRVDVTPAAKKWMVGSYDSITRLDQLIEIMLPKSERQSPSA